MSFSRITLATAGAAVLLAAACNTEKRLARRQRYLSGTYTALKAAMPDASITMMKDTVRVLFPRNVMFDYNRANIKTEFLPVMQRFAGVLRAQSRTHLFIVGRTDSLGGDNQYNLELSTRRADSARTALRAYGIADKRMEHWGVGAKDPIGDNRTEEGRALNRSAEFIILESH